MRPRSAWIAKLIRNNSFLFATPRRPVTPSELRQSETDSPRRKTQRPTYGIDCGHSMAQRARRGGEVSASGVAIGQPEGQPAAEPWSTLHWRHCSLRGVILPRLHLLHPSLSLLLPTLCRPNDIVSSLAARARSSRRRKPVQRCLHWDVGAETAAVTTNCLKDNTRSIQQ